MKRYLKAIILLCAIISTQVINGQSLKKNRVVILSDIEADPDDTESFVRLLLYSNQIDIKALIATTSVWLRDRVEPESIRKIVRAYGKVQPNLLKHEAGYPEAAKLLSLIKTGPAKYGMLGVGNGQDSEGSDYILKILEEPDDRPLYISVWGGVNTLAQTLHKIKNTKSATEAKRLIAKLRVYTISDQDDSGIWIRNNFPDLFYIVSPGDDYGTATWVAINSVIKGISNYEISNRWLEENIQQGHGPLGALYPDVSWGMEGDTPAFLNLIPNGLNNPEQPDWGGWGGRYELQIPETLPKKGNSGVPIEKETRPIWTDTKDYYTPFVPNPFNRTVKPDTLHYNDNKATLWRWREDFQNDFAARIDWCIYPYQKANHPPIPRLNQSETLKLKSGEKIRISAAGSSDPDGDHLSFLWFNYPEAGSYKQEVKFGSPENGETVWIEAPTVTKTETIHFILKVTDKGFPNLSRYKRIILIVNP